jgi:ElaB/YqjD/DUF883 family membrane-anchored ribosome-binding protein
MEDHPVTASTKTKLHTAPPADFDAIVNDLAALRRDFSSLMAQMKSDAVNGANGAANHAMDQLGDRADRLYDSVAAQGERSVQAITRQVEEQPVMSLLIAFGVGYFASRLLSR